MFHLDFWVVVQRSLEFIRPRGRVARRELALPAHAAPGVFDVKQAEAEDLGVAEH